MKPEERFESRGQRYHRGRPGYPDEAVAWAAGQAGLSASAVVADVGAGTGHLSLTLAQRFARVIAVEPAASMRAELARLAPGVELVAGSAQATTLPDASVDAIFVGQALHWFPPAETVREWRRILRSPWIVALWNDRHATTPLGRGFEALLDRGALQAPAELGHRPGERAALLTRWAAEGCQQVAERQLANPEHLDAARAIDFLASASYMPPPDSPAFAALAEAVHRLFAAQSLSPWTTSVHVLRLA